MEGLVVRTNDFGYHHRHLTILTSDGVSDTAYVYRSEKSKYRVPPEDADFLSVIEYDKDKRGGCVSLHRLRYFPTLCRDIVLYSAASIACELGNAYAAGTDRPGLYKSVVNTLTWLDRNASENSGSILQVLNPFLYYLSSASGIFALSNGCTRCGKFPSSGYFYYRLSTDEIYCDKHRIPGSVRLPDTLWELADIPLEKFETHVIIQALDEGMEQAVFRFFVALFRRHWEHREINSFSFIPYILSPSKRVSPHEERTDNN